MKKLFALIGLMSAVSLISVSQAGTDIQKDGSISVKDMKKRQYAAAAKIEIKDAIDAALQVRKGKVISAELEEEKDFLVYEVTIAASDGQYHEVLVDAGNKSILGMGIDDKVS